MRFAGSVGFVFRCLFKLANRAAWRFVLRGKWQLSAALTSDSCSMAWYNKPCAKQYSSTNAFCCDVCKMGSHAVKGAFGLARIIHKTKHCHNLRLIGFATSKLGKYLQLSVWLNKGMSCTTTS